MRYLLNFKLILTKIIALSFALFASNLLFAQSNQPKDDDFQSQFDNFTKQQSSDFSQFTSQLDAEFLLMLEQNWQEFDAMSPKVRDNKPKPKIAPSLSKMTKSTAIKQVGLINNSEQKISDAFDFFGNKITFPKHNFSSVKAISKDALILFWRENSQRNHQTLINKLSALKSSLQLSDWAFLKLTEQYAAMISGNSNQRIAIQWYLLNKSGYQAKTAISNSALVLLLPVKQNVYAVNYYKLKGVPFYQFSGEKAGRITSYNGNYNNVGLKLDLNFSKSLVTKAEIHNKSLEYQYAGITHQLKLPYDIQRIRYFSDYPQLDLKYYFQAPIGKTTIEGLQTISEQLTGNKENKLNQLLAIIHQSFPYAIDEVQFGKENYLMLEETLHYQASDCEDRSILFAWLATNLLHEKVVGLNYPGHVATGILREGKIITADPTFIGAKLGQIMTNYINIEPELIRYSMN